MSTSDRILDAAGRLGRPHCVRCACLGPGEVPSELASVAEKLACFDCRPAGQSYHLLVVLGEVSQPEVEELLRPGGLLVTLQQFDPAPHWTLEDTQGELLVRRRPSPTDLPLLWEFPDEPTTDFSLVMPFYNEEESIYRTITELDAVFSEQKVDFEIVAVDNGSTDQTAQILEQMMESNKRIRRISVFPNRGYGWGILHGLQASRGEAVGYMGGDGQVDPVDVLSTYQFFKSGRVDMAKVRRIKRGDGLTRAGISVIFNLLFSLATGFLESDTNASPKVFQRRRLPQLQLKSKDWFLDCELMMKARAERWRVVELDVHFLPRDQGSSYVRPGTLLEFFRNLVRAGYRLRAGRELVE